MRKTINYHGKNYLVDYSYKKKEKRINGSTEHTVQILRVDGEEIMPFSYSWSTTQEQSIIAQIKSAIDKYIFEHTEKFSYLKEFEGWSGQLDYWDE